MAAVLYVKVSNNVNAPSWCLLQLDSFPAYEFVISQQVTPGLTSQSQRGVSSCSYLAAKQLLTPCHFSPLARDGISCCCLIPLGEGIWVVLPLSLFSHELCVLSPLPAAI